MMGPTHALSGPVLTLAIQKPLTIVLAAVGLPPVTGFAVLPMVFASAGAGVLPDIDHPSSAPSNALGPVTRAISKVIHAISGHRGITHSLVGLAGFTLCAAALGRVGGWPYGVWLGFLAALAVIGLQWIPIDSKIRNPIKNPVFHICLCVSVGVGVALYARFIPFDSYPITVGTSVGVAAHILGDMCTKEGCPLFWPFPMRFHILELTTGARHPGERVFNALLWGGLAGLVLWRSGASTRLAHLVHVDGLWLCVAAGVAGTLIGLLLLKPKT